MPGYQALRLPDQYRALLDLPPVSFAWEWLRRNPDYRSLWSTAPAAGLRASALATTASRRSAAIVTVLSQHPLERRLAHLGLTFPDVARRPGD